MDLEKRHLSMQCVYLVYCKTAADAVYLTRYCIMLLSGLHLTVRAGHGRDPNVR